MPPLLTRLASHFRDARDEWVERNEDARTGHRDRYGRKTQKWYEREYEIERRRRKREARRREKAMVEGKEERMEKDNARERGKNKGRKKDKVVALMSGALPYEGEQGGRERGGSKTGSSGDTTLVEGEAGAHGETPITTHDGGHEGNHTNGAPSPDISPMPSSRSISSIRAEVHARKARAKAGNAHEGPRGSEDGEAGSSDDEGPSDDDDEEEEEGKAAKAAKKNKQRQEEGEREAAASGLRGGGSWATEEEAEEKWYSLGEEEEGEYCEREEWDAEYGRPGEKEPEKGSEHEGKGKGKEVDMADSERIRPNASTTAKQAAAPEHEDDRGLDAERHDLEDQDRLNLGFNPPPAVDEALKRNHERNSEKTTQPDGKPESCKPRPYNAPATGPKAEHDATTAQPRGRPGERESRPYCLPEVRERLKVQRPEPPVESGTSIRKEHRRVAIHISR